MSARSRITDRFAPPAIRVSGQGPERFEAMKEVRGHQHGQGAGLRHRDFRAENRRQMSGGNGASTDQILEQCRRCRPWQAEAVDSPRARVQDSEDRLYNNLRI